MTAALISSGVQSGWVCATSALMPATCGDDMEVPEYVTVPVPLPAATDEMRVPGAATSGFMAPSEPCTPRDEPLLRLSPRAGSCTKAAFARDGPRCTTTPPAWMAGRSASVEPAVSCAPGMPALPAMPAGKTGSSVPIRTPTAPASCALFQRTALPQSRVASLSSHHSQTMVPSICAA